MSTERERELNKEAAKRYRTKHREKYQTTARASYHKHSTENIKKQRNRRRDQAPYFMTWQAKHRAKVRRLPFDLTPDDVVIPDVCPVLGIQLARNTDGNTGGSSSPSLDRIVPALGYVRGNVRVISMRANTLKSDATAAEMKLVYEDLMRLEGQ